MSKDLYKTLGVSKDANEQEIRKSYKKLIIKYHPDRCKDSDAQQKMQDINYAYQILNSPKERANYDNQRRQGQYGQYSPYGGEQYNAQSQNFNFKKNRNTGFFNDFFDIGDILENMFFNTKQEEGINYDVNTQFKQYLDKTKDISLNIQLDLREYFKNIINSKQGLNISFDRTVKCNNCICNKCSGKGNIITKFASMVINVTCPLCKGKGIKNNCNICYGKLFITKNIKYTIPNQFVIFGAKIAFKGMGNQNSYSGEYTNLIIYITPINTGIFKILNNFDIYLPVIISTFDAMNGYQFKLPYFTQILTINTLGVLKNNRLIFKKYGVRHSKIQDYYTSNFIIEFKFIYQNNKNTINIDRSYIVNTIHKINNYLNE